MKAKHVAVGGLAAVLLFAAPPLSLAQPPPGTASREVIGLPSLAPLVESVKSAVVNVDVQSRVTASQFSTGSDESDDFFDRFFGAPGRRSEERRVGKESRS